MDSDGKVWSRRPTVSSFDAQSLLNLRIERGDGDFFDKRCAQFLDRTPGGEIVRVAGNRHRRVHLADKRGDGAAGLQRIPAPAKGLVDPKPDVAGGEADMFRIPHAKIDVPGI